tara:strand:+ start:164 stop:361 length:198 start_codon:yes stop_codon:yes gene_type:complete
MAYSSLDAYYKTTFDVVCIKKLFTLTELEHMIPFELLIYLVMENTYRNSINDQQTIADAFARAQQ